MTKALAALAAVVLLLLAAPAVTAHGAAAAREIDTRLLADDEGSIPYGGCFNVEVEVVCAPGLEAEGLDLVVLEVREAFIGAEPAVVFRIIFQTDDAHAGRTIELMFNAGGKDHAYSFATDGAAVPTGNFDALAGPFDAFDGYPKAVDAYLKYGTLGVKEGDQLTGIQVMSNFEDEASDVLPGTWFASGQEMPFIPGPESEVEAAEPATYALKGPAKLLEVSSNYEPGLTEVTLTVKNGLSTMPQFVTLTGPSSVTFENANLNLEAGASRVVKITLTTTSAPSWVNVTSDFDYFESIPLVEVLLEATATITQTFTGNATTSGHHEDGETEDQAEGKDAPGAPIALLTVAIAALAVLIRRRR